MKKCFIILLTLITVLSSLTLFAFAHNNEISINQDEWEALKLTNKERLKEGLSPLSMSATLQSVCNKREIELFTNFSHDAPDGTSAYSPKLDAANYTWSFTAENIATGFTSTKDVLTGWMNSAGHKRNILNVQASHIGIGFDPQTFIWVQIFAGICIVENMYIETNGNSEYTAGTDTGDFSEYIVLECSKHGKSYMPIDESMCTGYDPFKIGKQTITVTYNAIESLGGDTNIIDGMIWCGYKSDVPSYKQLTAEFEITIIPVALPPETTTKTGETTTIPETTTIDETATAHETTTEAEISETTTKEGEATTAETTTAEEEHTSEAETTTVADESTTENETTAEEDSSYKDKEEESETEKSTVYLEPFDFPADLTGDTAFLTISSYIENLSSFGIYKPDGTLTENSKTKIGTGFEFRCTLTDGTTVIFYSVVKGDVNGDGSVTAADARTVLRCSASIEILEGVFSTASDVTADNKITAADARKILRVSARLDEM